MIDSLWITGAYFFTIILGVVNHLVGKPSFTMFYLVFTAWIFILGGTHEVVYGEDAFTVFVGGACVLGGAYINHCFMNLRKLDQEREALEDACKVLKSINEEKLKRAFWSVRN